VIQGKRTQFGPNTHSMPLILNPPLIPESCDLSTLVITIKIIIFKQNKLSIHCNITTKTDSAQNTPVATITKAIYEHFVSVFTTKIAK
jgi:hypothetical protein